MVKKLYRKYDYRHIFAFHGVSDHTVWRKHLQFENSVGIECVEWKEDAVCITALM